MKLSDGPVVFVDVETNGMSHSRGRVIEVGAIRVEDGRITQSLGSLVDPGTDIPEFITGLTGIKRADIAGAPTFTDIADDLHDILEGALFVAHNVRFDYAFLKQEFRRVGKQFSPKLVCTVKLSKALYPALRRHRLENIIERCSLTAKNRHRAFDDASVLWQFIQHLELNFPQERLQEALKQQLRSPSLPKSLDRNVVSGLPEEHGVYIFHDENGSPLYVGKSVNIKKRVMSHFSADHKYQSAFKISQSVANIETRPTGGELEALILESRLIKELQPLYNRQLRRNQKLTLAKKVRNRAGYITVSLEDTATIEPENSSDILAVYTTKGKARSYLNEAIKNYLLCPKLMGFEKGRGSCFLYQLKKCQGACIGKEVAGSYNSRVLSYFEQTRIASWPFKSAVLIQEKTSETGSAKSIVVDNWCIIAEVDSQEHCTPEVTYHSRAFDLDTYKILRSFLNHKLDRLSIKPIKLQQLQNLA